MEDKVQQVIRKDNKLLLMETEKSIGAGILRKTHCTEVTQWARQHLERGWTSDVLDLDPSRDRCY